MTTPPLPRNPVGYFEIPVHDIDRAVAFYAAVFGFAFDRQTVDGYEMAFLPHHDGAPGASGALAKGDVYRPTRDGAILYLSVDDVAATLSRALAAGGAVLYPAKDIGPAGVVAEIEDSEGNRVALHAPHP